MNDNKMPHFINGKGVFNLVKIENTRGEIKSGFVIDIHSSIKHKANKDNNIDLRNIKNKIKAVHSKGDYTTSLDPTDSQYVCSIPSFPRFKAFPNENETEDGLIFNIKTNTSERQGNQEEILKAYEFIKQSNIDLSIFKGFDNIREIYFAKTETNCNYLKNKNILLPKDMHLWNSPEEIYAFLKEANVSVTSFYFFFKKINKKNVPETNTNQLNKTSNNIKHDNNKFKAAFNFNEDLFE